MGQTGSRRVASRIIKFLTNNLFYALLPLLIASVFRSLGAVPAPAGAYAPELLFFSIMIAAAAMGDMSDANKDIQNTPFSLIARAALFFGVVWAAALYGGYMYDSLIGAGDARFRSGITYYAGGLAIGLFIVSVGVEWLLARNQDGES